VTITRFCRAFLGSCIAVIYTNWQTDSHMRATF